LSSEYQKKGGIVRDKTHFISKKPGFACYQDTGFL